MMHVENRVNVLGVGVNATSMDDAVARLIAARSKGESGYVCVTGVHGIMESQRDDELRQIHNRSLMTVPDGMPTVWMGHEYGFMKMGRVYGPDLMLALCAATSGSQRSDVSGQSSEGKEPDSDLRSPTSERKGHTHFLYGATGETLRKLKENLEQRFPGIQIVGTYAPPFRPLTEAEDVDLQQQVAVCKPDFFWVGLSTPKQERFMFEHCTNLSAEVRGQTRSEADAEQRQRSGKLEDGFLSASNQRSSSDFRSPISDLCKFPLEAGILLGVGAAFDIHAGNIKDTPKWIQNAGLQWLHRLCKEPRRLWRRYLWIVPGFLWLAFLQLMGLKRFEPGAGC